MIEPPRPLAVDLSALVEQQLMDPQVSRGPALGESPQLARARAIVTGHLRPCRRQGAHWPRIRATRRGARPSRF